MDAFTVVLKVSALLLLALAAVGAGRGSSAAVRHWVLAAALASAAALPLFTLAVPGWQLPSRRDAGRDTAVDAAVTLEILDAPSSSTTAAPTASPAAAPGVGWPTVLFAVWLTGSVVVLAGLVVGLLRMRRIVRQAAPASSEVLAEAAAAARAVDVHRPVRCVSAGAAMSPMTVGWRRPVIVLPSSAAEWPIERLRVVLAHELAHVRRGDWSVQWVAELVRASYWFNPVVWLACDRLRQESECACDDEVLDRGVDARAYASHLVDLARTCRSPLPARFPAPAVARPSTLRRRIAAMLNARIDRRRTTFGVRAAATALVLAVSLPLAGFGGQGFATVTGTVHDVAGGVMANTTLALAAADDSRRHEVKTDGAGAFSLTGVGPGDYVLEVKAMGFETHRSAVTLTPGQTLVQPVVMQVGTLQETINVARSAVPADDTRPARAAVTATPACEPVAGGGRIVPPKKVRHVRPVYPDTLDATGPATVLLEATIGTDGVVRRADVTSAVSADVADAAREAVLQWRFTPTLLNCVPTEVRMKVTVTFRPE